MVRRDFILHFGHSRWRPGEDILVGDSCLATHGAGDGMKSEVKRSAKNVSQLVFLKRRSV
jgi:hypothetical protein